MVVDKHTPAEDEQILREYIISGSFSPLCERSSCSNVKIVPSHVRFMIYYFNLNNK